MCVVLLHIELKVQRFYTKKCVGRFLGEIYNKALAAKITAPAAVLKKLCLLCVADRRSIPVPAPYYSLRRTGA